MILVKKLKFFHVLCLSKIDREKVSAGVLHKKEAFKNYKNTGLIFLCKIDREKVSGNVLVRKKFL